MYEVNWDDEFHPIIILSPEGDQTFTEAKQELIDAVRNKVRHWRLVLNQIKKLKKADVEEKEDLDDSP